MAEPSKTDARAVLEKIRTEKFQLVSAEALTAVYAVEREKQYEIDRDPVRVILREIVDRAAKDLRS